MSFHFWNKPICLNSDHYCSGRSTQVQNGDYWLQEINLPHNSVNRLNWFRLTYDYSHQIWMWYYFVFSSNEISKTLNAYISKLVLLHLSTSSPTSSISYKVDYQCLVLTNSNSNLVGVIHTRGQHTESHSTGEDWIYLIVAVFLREQLKAVWLKFGVLYFRCKKLKGVGSTLTFLENDHGVGLPWHSS